MIKEIIHKGEKRLALELEYNNELLNYVKKIPSRKWSKTLRIWHFPDNTESREYLKKYFHKMYNDFISNEIKNHKTENINNNATDKVLLYKTNQRLILILQWNKKNVEFLKTLKYYSYDNIEKRWLITNNEYNFNTITEYFAERIKIEEKLPIIKAAKKIAYNELHIVEHQKGRIKIIFKFNKELVALLRTFPYRTWDEVNGWWTTVNTEEVINELEKFCDQNKIKIKYFSKSQKIVKGRLMKEQIPNYRVCPEKYLDKLRLLRYSKNTLKTYSSNFEEFINYYHNKKIEDISEKEIIEFTRYLVVERGVSESYQNQSINAIKFYYERVLGESRKFYYLDRPKREKNLPVVLTKQEVKAMIDSTNNIKHKCLIMLIYSAGLRVSEAINLKINDIDSGREVINIRKGKGKKDRISLLSKDLLINLREYYKLYQPKEYLFTGKDNAAYSSSSVLKIVKRTAKRANINKHVTTHTLRHSFATHLLEQGTDLRYIQNLLGHASSKTTEIYTHITRKGMENIKNPLDDMGI